VVRFRFSIASMMAAILIIALSFAALKKYSPPGRLLVTGYSEPPGNVAGYVAGLQRYRQSSHSVLTLGCAAMGAILGYSHAVRRDRAAGTEEAVTSEP
jgi:hypothetical protein